METDELSWLSTAKILDLLVLSIPSTQCSVLIFIYFYKERKNLSIHLHFTLLLIMINFLQITTDLPFTMTYYHYGEVISTSNAFCLWRNWWDYSTSGLLLVTVAWGSVERHLLIFHDSLMSTRRKRIIFHMLPMLMVCVYPLIFYFGVIILNSCENKWDYTILLCIQPCYLIDQPTLGTYDFLANIVFPVTIVTLANAWLIIRVVRQKRSRRASWSRQRKLTMQLLYVALMHIIFWIPLTVNDLILTFTSSPIALDLQIHYFFFFVDMVPILLPFVLVFYLPHFTKTVFSRRQNRIAPLPQFTKTVFSRRRKRTTPLHHIT